MLEKNDSSAPDNGNLPVPEESNLPIVDRFSSILAEFILGGPIFGFGPLAGLRGSLLSSMPRANIFETDTEIIVVVDAPGFKKEEIKVEALNRILTISGRSSEETREDDSVVSERRSQFKRSFSLPNTADIAQISASLKDGCLTITIPKREVDPNEGRVEVLEG
ncbi:Hsp20/alpha crystallin family protein [Patescibacteria group bacterium]|nr:Hsp20/alpha crystallin family protein [Patescibacteria group bacterium]